MGRVVFFGSPDFAIPSFEALLDTPYRPVMVVTQPDRRSLRGGKPAPTPVRQAAEKNNIPVMVADNLEGGHFFDKLKEIGADFFVVVAFGLIFPSRALEIAGRANINVHASLLPAYRGASPVNHAIVKGEQFTGVTTMEMSESLDQGPLYLQRAVSIDPNEDAGSLFSRLAALGGILLLDTLKGIESGTLESVVQPEEGASWAPLLKKEDGEIPWKNNAIKIHNHIRGMCPWPGSFTYHNGNYIKVHKAEPVDMLKTSVPAGTVLNIDEKEILVSCGVGNIGLKVLQLEGRRALPVGDFVRGYSLKEGDVLGR
jgi:methionyl-tRNA formyltransferase